MKNLHIYGEWLAQHSSIEFSKIDQYDANKPWSLLRSYGDLGKICEIFFSGRITYSDALINANKEIIDTYPKITAPFFLRLNAKPNHLFIRHILDRLLLYRSFILMTVPLRFSAYSLSYSNVGGLYELNDADYSKLLELNTSFGTLFSNQKVLFLPESYRYYGEGASFSGTTIDYKSPSFIDTHDHDLLPINICGNDSHVEKRIRSLFSITLPFFPGVDLHELVKIKENETDAFIVFEEFLTTKLRYALQSQSIEDLVQVEKELDSEVRRIRIECEKLRNLRVLQGVNMSLFSVSLAALSPDAIPIPETLAAIVGSTTFIKLLENYYKIKEKKLDLKNSDYYIPFLLDSIAEKTKCSK